MIVKLFDIQNSKVVPTEHCYTLKFLKDIMEEYPKTHLNVYQYLFYMTYPCDRDWETLYYSVYQII